MSSNQEPPRFADIPESHIPPWEYESVAPARDASYMPADPQAYGTPVKDPEVVDVPPPIKTNHGTKFGTNSLWINDQNERGRVVFAGWGFVVGTTSYPHNESAEKGVICGILSAGLDNRGNEVFESVAHLTHRDFYVSNYAYIWRALCRLKERGQQMDVPNTAMMLSAFKRGNTNETYLDAIGGVDVLYALSQHPAYNIETHAKIMRRMTTRRTALVGSEIMRQLSTMSQFSEDEFAVFVQQISAQIVEPIHEMSAKTTHTLADSLDGFRDEMRHKTDDGGIPTGYRELDEYISGWRKSKLYAIGALTSHGKSAFLMNAALNSLKQGKKVLFVTLEMSPREYMSRILAIMSGVDGSRIDTFRLTPAETERMDQAVTELKDMEKQAGGFSIVALNQPTLALMESKINEVFIKQGFDIVFVDYASIYKFAPDTPKQERDNTFFAGMIWSTLERLKNQFDVPFVTATQLNRNYQSRAGQRPRGDDIEYSSQAEKSADFVAILFREGMVTRDCEDPNKAELTIYKNRAGGGVMNVVTLRYDAPCTRFTDYYSHRIDLTAL